MHYILTIFLPMNTHRSECTVRYEYDGQGLLVLGKVTDREKVHSILATTKLKHFKRVIIVTVPICVELTLVTGWDFGMGAPFFTFSQFFRLED